MINLDIAHQRLCNQGIALAPFERPVDVVQWFGAIQAQDYLGALWAVGLRMPGAIEADIEQAIADGSIVRTHPMRGTWHFVAGADVRWLLSLTARRMIARCALMYRQLELDDAAFAISNSVIARMLQGGKQLTRRELAAALEQAGISTNGLRLTFLMSRAELDGVVVGGSRRGKQFTYALLDELVPTSETLTRDEALAELARRYFTSHGPATVQDFAWWSSLTLGDARAGLEMARPHLVREVIDGQTYWLSPSLPTAKITPPTTYVLPPFDEYTVAYKDRSAVLEPEHIISTQNGIFNPIIVVNGQVVGTWKRTITKNAVIFTPNLFIPLNEAEMCALAASVDRYSAFLGMPVKNS